LEVDCGLQKWSVVISFFWPLLEQLLRSQSGSRSGNDFWAAMPTIFINCFSYLFGETLNSSRKVLFEKEIEGMVPGL